MARRQQQAAAPIPATAWAWPPGLAEAESETLRAGLVEAACRPPRVWTHSWTPGDAVVWDNRRLLHRAMPWDMAEPRVMHHSRIAGDVGSEGGERKSG